VELLVYLRMLQAVLHPWTSARGWSSGWTSW